MGILDNYRLNDEAVEKGVRFDIGEDDWIVLRYAGPSNTDYSKEVTEATRRIQRTSARGVLSPEQDRQVLAEVYAKAVVVKWGGKGDLGKIGYSVAKVVKTFTEYPEFFRDVQDLANNLANFRDEEITGTAKK